MTKMYALDVLNKKLSTVNNFIKHATEAVDAIKKDLDKWKAQKIRIEKLIEEVKSERQ